MQKFKYSIQIFNLFEIKLLVEFWSAPDIKSELSLDGNLELLSVPVNTFQGIKFRKILRTTLLRTW